MTSVKDIRRLTLEEIGEWCKSNQLPLFRASQIYGWLWKKSICTFDEMTDLPAEMRKQLANEFAFYPVRQKEKLVSTDGTVKFSFVLHDGHCIEGVIIPAEDRTTACISTQAGCPLACRFCATGKMGFSRDLDAGEIFDQFMEMNNESISRYNHPLNNIVYMGMGEPLLNYDQMLISVRHLTDHKQGMGISQQRITVSTAGIPSGIRALADDETKFQLAVSLHSADQKKREEIMPVARKYPLEELSAAVKYYHEETGSRITFEYLLLLDFNDGMKDVRQLAEFCLDFPVKINLIEYNEIDGMPFKRSLPERTKAFKAFLEDRNMIVNIRQSKGLDIHAACGQLAGKI